MMNTIKKLLGFVWMIMAPSIILFLVYQAVVKITAASAAAKANTILQWVIILLIFLSLNNLYNKSLLLHFYLNHNTNKNISKSVV